MLADIDKIMSRIQSCIRAKCPSCESGEVYQKRKGISFSLPVMNENCSECGHKFLKEPGFFQGAMYVSYGLAMAITIATFILCQFFFEKTFEIEMFYVISGVVILSSWQNYKYSRIIWMYMFTSKEASEE